MCGTPLEESRTAEPEREPAPTRAEWHPVAMHLDAGLMTILVCPTCRSQLAVDDDAAQLVCNACPRRYDVRNGVPMMYVDDTTA